MSGILPFLRYYAQSLQAVSCLLIHVRLQSASSGQYPESDQILLPSSGSGIRCTHREHCQDSRQPFKHHDAYFIYNGSGKSDSAP